MIEPDKVVERLTARGIDLFAGVPDSLLKSFCSYVMASLPPEQHVITANEGAAVGIAIGSYLRTGNPALVYLQNSGFGNTINPLLSLADPEVYGIPMLVLVGWRGQPGVQDEPQHVKQGRIQTQLLEALDLPWAVLPSTTPEGLACVDTAIEVAVDRSSPYVLLVERGTFSATAAEAVRGPIEDLPSREEALIAVVESLGEETINVSTTGMLSRELFEYRTRNGQTGDFDFLTVGGMGHASSIALGIALNESRRQVWCLDGDGALLMHLGTLAVIAQHAPANLFHVVFNNGVHDSVGGQPTSIHMVDVPQLAISAGYRKASTASDISLIPSEIKTMRDSGGPALLELRVRPGNRPDIGRPTRSPADSKRTFAHTIR